MTAPLAAARCLDLHCDWTSDQPGLALLGGEAQRHADATGHAVYLTYTIPARAGCDPITVQQQAQAEDDVEATRLGLCRCSSDELDRTPCPVHGKAVRVSAIEVPNPFPHGKCECDGLMCCGGRGPAGLHVGGCDEEGTVMGYTHYYTQKRHLTEEEWTEFADATLAIINAYGKRLSRDGEDEELGPLVGSEMVMFNGMPGDECEPFEVVREKTGFQFVKTRELPYDEPVTACLAALSVIARGAFDIGTDGNSTDWKPGLALARKACPSLTISYPVTR